MPVISVTRFRLRSHNPLGYALFMWHTVRSGRQAERTPGFLAGRLMADRGRAFWTVTAWADATAMRGFRSSGDHRRAMGGMKILDRFCDEAATATWTSPTERLPEEAEMHGRLEELGRFFHLSRPSPDHARQRIASPSPLGGSVLRPRSSRGMVSVRSGDPS